MLARTLRRGQWARWPAAMAMTAFAGGVYACNTKVWNDEGVNVDASPLITQVELAKHNSMGDLWVAIHGHVYDVSEFVESHPGGVDKLLQYAGKDGTRGFRMQHPEVYLERFLDPEWYKGELLKERAGNKKKAKAKTKAQTGEKVERVEGSSDEEYYKALAREHVKPKKKKEMTNNAERERLVTYTHEQKPHLSQIFSLSDFETVAKHLLPPLVYAYIQSGADNEYSVRENRRALGRIFFRPRCLVDVHHANPRTKVLGSSVELPFIIGTLNGSQLMDGKGDENMVIETASNNGVLTLISQNSQVSLDSVAQRNASVLYQFSIDGHEELEGAGKAIGALYKQYPNIKGFLITIDAPVVGNKERYKKLEAQGHQYSDHPAPQVQTREYCLTWKDLAKVRAECGGAPIVVGGLQRPDDVMRCKEMGFHGAMISNHCGKTLDQGLAPIEVLKDVHKHLGGKPAGIELFVEGGFRRGSDVLKAICLGATPAISKPILFSQLYGEEGVAKSLEILRSEIIRGMKFLGVNSVSELDSSFLDTESLSFRVNTVDDDNLYASNYTAMPPPPFKNQHHLKFV